MTDTVRIVRSFAAEALEVADGRTIVGRCVPYDEVGLVADGGGEPYREVWRAGAFRRVIRGAAAGRLPAILLNYEHRTDLANAIGRTVELDDRADGLWGTFRAHDTAIGEQGLELVRCGAVTGLSVQAHVPTRRRVLGDGTVERSLATRLEHVAVTASPSWAGAGVTAVRSVDLDLDDDLETPAGDEVRAWLDAARVRFTPTS